MRSMGTQSLLRPDDADDHEEPVSNPRRRDLKMSLTYTGDYGCNGCSPQGDGVADLPENVCDIRFNALSVSLCVHCRRRLVDLLEGTT